MVAGGGSSGTGRLSAECPQVVARHGVGINQDDTYLVTRLPIAAPEILQVGGREYIACLESSLKGIRVAPLN